jgi:hypothetical protein
MELIEKDLERLKMVLESIEKGTATSYDKPACIEALNAIIEPKCAICRIPIREEMIVINGRKMHEKCSAKYKR